MSCIFCKIIAGEIPAAKVYEDETCFAFLDIQPVHKGHTLLVPKAHHEMMINTPDELVATLYVTAKKLMKAIKLATGCDFVMLSVVGVDVPHFHIHLMPRFSNDGLHGWPTQAYEAGEDVEVAKKISDSL
jgi:histidine triad (HIT) family protein